MSSRVFWMLACLFSCAVVTRVQGETVPVAEIWHRTEGDSLIIGADGVARFVDSAGRTLLASTVELSSRQPAANQGLQLVFVLTLSFTWGDTTCVVPGYFMMGEGEAPGLTLQIVPAPLGSRLRKLLGIERCGELSYRGRGPYEK